MCNRRGQLSGRCLTANMSELRQPIPGFDFSIAALSPLPQQHDDKNSLGQDYSADSDGLPAVSLPECRRAKTDLAAGRQVRFTDLPSLHLTPIENRLDGTRRRG